MSENANTLIRASLTTGSIALTAATVKGLQASSSGDYLEMHEQKHTMIMLKQNFWLIASASNL